MAHAISSTPFASSLFAPRRRALQPSAEPNVIPFIDVLLVLLVIFMVTAPKPTVDIPVDLPQAGRVVSVGDPTIVVLRESSAGLELFVGAERVDMATLGARTLAHVTANNPQLLPEELYAHGRVFVRADQAAAYGNVVWVIETLKRDGFAQVGIFAETAQDA